MITLDLDLSYLSRHYNIGTSALKQYQDKSITQIMKIEAAKGNSAAAEFLMKITTNPEELARLFQLVQPKNRFLILSHMNEDDLMKVMEHLETEQFLLGLSIFTQDALCKLMMALPPETLATVVLEKMDANMFMNMIPTKYLDEFLSSDKMDRNLLMKAMENVDEEQLQKMMENVTGQSCYDDSDTILQKMSSFSDDDFMRAVGSMEPEGKQQLISNLLQEKPELFEEFSPEAMVHPFTTMKKEDVLKSLGVLEPQEFLPMMQELPKEIMALVATQIDPLKFAELLGTDFKDVLSNCGLSF